MAEEVKHYLFSMLEEEVNSSGSVHPLWAALAAGFLGNLNLSVSSWVHGHDLTEVRFVSCCIFRGYLVFQELTCSFLPQFFIVAAGHQVSKCCCSSCL